MQNTKHIEQRMNQRGIRRAEVQAALDYGRIEQDRYLLGNKEIDKELQELESKRKLLKKLRDKGGVVVVLDNDQLITTYRYNSYKRSNH